VKSHMLLALSGEENVKSQRRAGEMAMCRRPPPASKQSRARSQQHTNLVPHPLLPSSVPFFDPTCAVALGFFFGSFLDGGEVSFWEPRHCRCVRFRATAAGKEGHNYTAHSIFKYLMFKFFILTLNTYFI
jgi:hypothetical protein